MKHTELPWEYDNDRGLVTENGRDTIICQFFSKSENVFFNADANAEFIVKAVNNHEKLMDALEGLLKLIDFEQHAFRPQIEKARAVLKEVE